MTAAAALRLDADETVEAPRPCLVDVFQNRCEARAILVNAGMMDWHQAIDELWEDAEGRYGLVAAIGADEVQCILGNAFRGVLR